MVRKMLEQISTRIFADGADLDGILALAGDPRIAGFTTNPTLMWKAGLTDYAEFAKRLLERITRHPISFEVFADDAAEMRRQARIIAAWGENVYVKIPVTTTSGESMAPLVRELSEDGVQVNVTALFTTAQVELITGAVKDGAPSYISVFAGRIADAGIDPVPIMSRSVQIMLEAPRSELIWASPREILNLVQADQVGCHIITVTHDLLKKLDCLGKNLEQFSLETVRMFHGDAVAAGFTL
jgi:transaldolase